MAAEEVRKALEKFDAAGRIRTMPGAIHTVELAAAALGVEPARIAKTLAVRLKGSGRVLAIVAKGTARLDNAKFKARFGGKAGFVGLADCLEVTGHPPGGLCPFGLKEGVEVWLDTSLREFEVVYPAAGEVDNCVAASMAELEAWSGGQWVDVCV